MKIDHLIWKIIRSKDHLMIISSCLRFIWEDHLIIWCDHLIIWCQSFDQMNISFWSNDLYLMGRSSNSMRSDTSRVIWICRWSNLIDDHSSNDPFITAIDVYLSAFGCGFLALITSFMCHELIFCILWWSSLFIGHVVKFIWYHAYYVNIFVLIAIMIVW